MTEESPTQRTVRLIREDERSQVLDKLQIKVHKRLVEAEQILDPHDAWLAMAYREVLRMIKEARDG